MKTLTFKVNDDEARLIRALAKRERTSLSEFLRRRAMGVGGRQSCVPERVRCPFTGAMVFAALPGQGALTTEAVREMLTEFP